MASLIGSSGASSASDGIGTDRFKGIERPAARTLQAHIGNRGTTWRMRGSGGKMAQQVDPSDLDPGIRDSVLLLRKAGFKTFTSCEGGKGHSFRYGTIGLELDGDYRTFQKRLVTFLRSQMMEHFTISLVTDYPAGKSYVYLKGLDLLSLNKRKKVIQAVRRKERRLREKADI